ncbi:MAG: hypothetical protein RLZZ86_4088 [Cyanobacteriota bacterium]|jgi:hypothetical protein
MKKYIDEYRSILYPKLVIIPFSSKIEYYLVRNAVTRSILLVNFDQRMF